MTKLKGKRVLVTGAAAGIGLCTAEAFSARGCEVVLTDIDAAALDTALAKVRAHGAVAHGRVVDVTQRAQVEELARWVIDELGGLDVLVNNAGVGYHGELATTSLETWKRLIDVNFWGPLYHTYAFLPHFRQRGGGHIVNVSSGQAFLKLPTWGAYASIKAALGVFSEVLHYEQRKHGVQVSSVYPFMVNTGFYEGIEGHTWAAKLSMKLVPYYSMSPEKIAALIVRSVRRNTAVELTHVVNEIGFLAQVVPFAREVISRGSTFLLAGGEDKAA